MKKALFIGGTGTISMAITRLLAHDKEWRLFLLNRGQRKEQIPENATVLTADINDAQAVGRLVEKHRFDVVADFIAFRPQDVQRDLDLFADKTGQYIFISSASAYQKPVASLPITESTPLRNPYWQYSRDKIACEELLTQRYRDSGFPVTIVRPSHTYSYTNLPLAVHGKQKNWQTLARLRAGRPVVIPGDGTSLWTVTHADDFAPGFAGLMADPRAYGHAFHITGDDVLTWNQIYGHLAGALGVELNAVHIASEELARSNPDFEGTLLGDKAHSVVFDTTKLRRLVPAFNPVIRFSDAARTAVDTFLGRPELQIPDPEFDAWCDRMTAGR